MKISKDSWHYRVCNSFSWMPSTSLCLYFWQVVWASFLNFILIPVAVLLLVSLFLFGVPLILGSVLVRGFQEIAFENLHTMFYCWGLGFLTMLGMIGCFVMKMLYDEGMLWQREETVEKEPSIVVEWIKAKKRKVCPVITFTNKEKKDV